MSEKRHQVFVSSTFTDLLDERQEVLRSLLRLECFPAGMELFPAADEEQLTFIKHVIDDCDYYVLIVGGRYGTIVPASGRSYTEEEYRYAKQQGVPVLVFLRRDPDSLPDEKRDADPTARLNYSRFYGELATDRLVDYWTNPKELGAQVVYALLNAIKTKPRTGWIRGSELAQKELLERLEKTRDENEKLREAIEVADLGKTEWQQGLADGDDTVVLSGVFYVSDPKTYAETYAARPWECTTTWDALFNAIGPDIWEAKHESTARRSLARWAFEGSETEAREVEISQASFDTVKVQLLALGVLEVAVLELHPKSKSLMWVLTPRGRERLLRLRSLMRTPDPDRAAPT